MSKDLKFYKNLIFGYYERLKSEIISNLPGDERSKNISHEYLEHIKVTKNFNYSNLEQNLNKIHLYEDINYFLFEKKFLFFIKSPLNNFGQLIQTDKFITFKQRKIIENHVTEWSKKKKITIKVNSLDEDELVSYLMVKFSIDLWNQLSTLELCSENFSQLNELHLMCHQLNKIENCFKWVLNCQNLHELHLQSNCIQILETNCFKDLCQLRKLNLSKNSLTSISKCLNGLVNLEYLDLSMNKIENLDEMCFCDLKNLIFVNLSFNSIKLLDLNTLNECQNLLEFKATNNLIRQVVLDVLVKKILVLDLKWNFIEIFSKEKIDLMPSLRRLDLSFNKKFV